MISKSKDTLDFHLSRSIEPQRDLPGSVAHTQRASRVGDASRPDRALDVHAQHAVTGELNELPPDSRPLPRR